MAANSEMFAWIRDAIKDVESIACPIPKVSF